MIYFKATTPGHFQLKGHSLGPREIKWKQTKCFSPSQDFQQLSHSIEVLSFINEPAAGRETFQRWTPSYRLHMRAAALLWEPGPDKVLPWSHWAPVKLSLVTRVDTTSHLCGDVTVIDCADLTSAIIHLPCLPDVVWGAWQLWHYFCSRWQMVKVGAPFCHLACWKWHQAEQHHAPSFHLKPTVTRQQQAEATRFCREGGSLLHPLALWTTAVHCRL